MTKEAMKLALEALENSVDLVREDAYEAEKLYGNYPTRQGKVNGLKVLADDHEKAITALREALAEQPAPVAEPHKQEPDNSNYRLDPPGLDSLYTSPQPAQQEPVAWMTEERYAEMHTSKWTPKIQQVFSKDGILESQTIQYAPQSKPVPYPLAQRTWLGLTDEEIGKCIDEVNATSQYGHHHFGWHLQFARAIEAKLRSKNT